LGGPDAIILTGYSNHCSGYSSDDFLAFGSQTKVRRFERELERGMMDPRKGCYNANRRIRTIKSSKIHISADKLIVPDDVWNTYDYFTSTYRGVFGTSPSKASRSLNLVLLHNQTILKSCQSRACLDLINGDLIYALNTIKGTLDKDIVIKLADGQTITLPTLGINTASINEVLSSTNYPAEAAELPFDTN
jgi:hypothetical protein